MSWLHLPLRTFWVGAWRSIPQDQGTRDLGAGLVGGLVAIPPRHLHRQWLAAQKAARVFRTDPGMGIVRHVDAGYERAVEVAKKTGVQTPLL